MTTTSTRPRTALLSQVPTQQLHWLWQHYIPLGHLTLLGGPPGIGTSLLALHLAACVTAGLPLPDGTVCPKGGGVIIASHDSAIDTIKPRLEAAGGDPNHIILLGNAPHRHLDTNSDTEASQYRPFDLAQDFSLLKSFIHFIEATLVILDPITLTNVSFAQRLILLTHLADLAQRTGCAILLIRPIGTPSKTLLSSPAHLATSAARDPIQTAVRSRLLLLPDPVDKETLVLHCPKHCLGPQPASQACLISATEQHLPILLWLGEPYDPIAEQDAASHCRQRQYLLDTLRQSDTALDALTLSRTCIQSYHALRKMLQRLVHQGQLVSPARGLFTTPGHPCLLHFPQNSTASTGGMPTHNDPSLSVAARFIAPAEPNGSTPLNPPTTSAPNAPTIPHQPSHPNFPPSESHVPNVATLSSNPTVADITNQLPTHNNPSTLVAVPFITPNENEPLTIVAAQSIAPTRNDHTSAKDTHCLSAMENEPLTVVSARFIAPLEPSNSTPPDPSTASPSYENEAPIVVAAPSIASTENGPLTAVAARFIAPEGPDGSMPPNPNPSSHESHVPNVATTQTQHEQPSAEDLYPSVMIRPRKQYYDYD